jgi:hypothetical protein
MVLYSSRDGVLLKFQKKKEGPPVKQHGLFEPSIVLFWDSLDNTFEGYT